MTTIIATKSTAFKTRIAQISELGKSEKKTFSQNQSLSVVLTMPAKNKHIMVKLAEPITLENGKEVIEGYIYQNHWKGDILEPSEIKLPVVWRSQRNNTQDPYRECSLTSHTMAIDYLYTKFLSKSFSDKSESKGFSYYEPEDYYRSILSKFGDTTDHNAHTKAFQALGIDSYFSYSLSIKDLYELLMLKIPVILGVKYKVSGHIVLAVGFNAHKDCFYVHDPYGTRLGSRDQYDPYGGDYDLYSVSLLEKIWVDIGFPHNPECGWGRVFVSVDGIPTGAKVGL